MHTINVPSRHSDTAKRYERTKGPELTSRQLIIMQKSSMMWSGGLPLGEQARVDQLNVFDLSPAITPPLTTKRPLLLFATCDRNHLAKCAP